LEAAIRETIVERLEECVEDEDGGRFSFDNGIEMGRE